MLKAPSMNAVGHKFDARYYPYALSTVLAVLLSGPRCQHSV